MKTYKIAHYFISNIDIFFLNAALQSTRELKSLHPYHQELITKYTALPYISFPQISETTP